MICKDLETSTALEIVYPGETIYFAGVGSFMSVVKSKGLTTYTKNCPAKDIEFRRPELMLYRLVKHSGQSIELLDNTGKVILTTHPAYDEWILTLMSDKLEPGRNCSTCDKLIKCEVAHSLVKECKKDLTQLRLSAKILSEMVDIATSETKHLLQSGYSVEGYELQEVVVRGKPVTRVISVDK